jgi:hypothetical protein
VEEWDDLFSSWADPYRSKFASGKVNSRELTLLCATLMLSTVSLNVDCCTLLEVHIKALKYLD